MKILSGAIVKSAASTSRAVGVIVSTAGVDRQGDQILQAGIDLTNFKKNPVVLWQHDVERPVARAASIGATARGLEAVAQFPPAGTSADADQIYGLIQAGVVNAASISIIAKKMEPVDRAKPYAGTRIILSEMLEFSFCTLPVNAECLVVARATALTREPRSYERICAERAEERREARARARKLLDEIGWR